MRRAAIRAARLLDGVAHRSTVCMHWGDAQCVWWQGIISFLNTCYAGAYYSAVMAIGPEQLSSTLVSIALGVNIIGSGVMSTVYGNLGDSFQAARSHPPRSPHPISRYAHAARGPHSATDRQAHPTHVTC